ncbi:YhgE/Pip domain-containing protein [Nocardia sp. NPDC058640]|uniref:YhgE/Pip domain-containing protein n=1 Tax=Nocardia sp. NPDC058640 TaxID=3346571 RepID=UPI003650E002
MTDNTARTRTMPLREWLAPITLVAVLAALLGTMYLGYTADPEKHLHDFPIALVNQDVGDTVAGKPADIGGQITAALHDNIPADKIDLREVGLNEAQRQLRNGEVYGAIVIPGDFTKRVAILGTASVVPGQIEQPIISVLTNPRAGTLAAQIMSTIADQAMTQVNTTVGTQLTDQVEAAIGTTPLSGAAQLQLTQPIDVVVTPYHPLPEGTGQGLAAFFYTLVLLIVGFSGAMMINSLVDASLGFIPAEYGPWHKNTARAPISRARTLLIKWAIAAISAPIASAVFLGIGLLLNMSIERPLMLFLYGALAIAAIAITGLSVMAAFGTAGLMINLIVFVVLGIPSSSGTIPLEATPRWIADMASFEPMHQIYLAVRAILFFDGHLEAGMAQGLWMTLAGLAIGLTLGAAATNAYDLRGMDRLGAKHSAPAP